MSTPDDDERGKPDLTDSKEFSDVQPDSGVSGSARQTTIIKAASGEYWAELELEYEWDSTGKSFTCQAKRYRALRNGESKGNVFLRFKEDAYWEPTFKELTKDDAIQDGQWHDISGGGSVSAHPFEGIMWFRYIYDRKNVSDVQMEKAVSIRFTPSAPSVNPIDIVPDRTFDVTGRGVVGAEVSIFSSTGTFLGKQTIPASAIWTVRVSIPSSADTLTFYANQQINFWTSPNSSPVTVTLFKTPNITDPKANDIISVPKPTISGTGHSGATIGIYEANYGGVLYGSGNVSNGSWSIPLTEPLPNRRIILVAGQTFNGSVRWSNEVPVDVRPKPGTLLIGNPPANTIVNSTFDISGTGGAEGADIKVMLDLQDRVVGTTQAQGDSWGASVTIPADIPPGEVRLVAQQTRNGVPSDRSDYRPFSLKPSQPAKLTVQVDAQGNVTLGGVGHIGATFYLHVVNNGTPFRSFTVTTSPWTVLFPDWLPGTSLVNGRQSVPDDAGQPIYSDWISEGTTVEVPVPPPTLSFRVSPDGIPTFSGRGRNWSGQPPSKVEVWLSNSGAAIVPIVDVHPDTTWSSTATERWAPGTYSVTAAQRFITQLSTWVEPVFVVISAPPAVIEKVTPNGLSAEVVGQCWPGAQLTITFSDNPASHTVADTDRNGQWDFRRSTAFRPGRHTVTVTQTFGGQTSSPVSMSFEIAMSVPVITPPPNGQTDHLPELQGTGGIEGGKIQVFDFVTLDLLGEATATGDVWSVKLLELEYREYTVFATQSLDELQSQRSASVTFKVVLFAPRIDFPKTRTSVPRTFTVEGYARAGKDFDRTEVEVYFDGVPYRVYPHFGDGYFKQNFTRPLGPCVLKARQYFKEQESPLSQDVLVTIVPDKAIIETPAIGEAVGKNSVICGFGYPEDEVVVALPGGMELGRAKVHEDGTWFCSIEIPGTGTDLSLVTEQRKGEFHSGWSEPRALRRLAAPPTFDEPQEGKWEATRAGFAGGALAGSKVDVLPWYNAEEKHANALVTDGGRWAGASERNLPAGPQWARAVQVVGGQRSIPADSKRFEIAPSDEPPRRHPTPE